MDWSRFCYKAPCRFNKDSDQEVMIQWYPVPDDAPQLPYPTLIRPLFFTTFPELSKVGEVYGKPRTYTVQQKKRGVPAGHVCGTADDFQGGGTLNTTDPPVQYDEQGLPLCCQANAVPLFTPQVALTLPDVPLSVWYTTCQFAQSNPTLLFDYWYFVDTNPALSAANDWWLAANPPADGPFAIESTAPLPPGVTAQLYSGNCVNPLLISFMNPGTQCVSNIWYDNGASFLTFRVRITNSTGTRLIIPFRVRPGAC